MSYLPYLILGGVFALWVLYDGLARNLGGLAVLWSLGTQIAGPIVVPLYFALRPLKTGEIREGGRAWNILRNFAIFWTISIAIGSIAALIAAVRSAEVDLSNSGITSAMEVLAALWLFPTGGAALLGFLLKKNSVVENGPTGSMIAHDSAERKHIAGIWAGVGISALIALIAVRLIAVSMIQQQGDRWKLRESVSVMDSTPEVSLTKAGTNGATLIIRCAGHETDAYVITGTTVKNNDVRVRFNDSAPIQQNWQNWDKSTNDALFAPDAMVLARQLAISKSFAFEFTPSQENPRTVKFDVSGLSAKLHKISAACECSP